MAQEYLDNGIRQKVRNKDPFYTYPALAVHWEFEDWGTNSKELKCNGIFYDTKSHAELKKGFYDVGKKQKEYQNLIEEQAGIMCFKRNF